MKTLGVIPARYGSTRFPGKPLADIHGKPMIWWTYWQVKKVKEIDEVYVLTDDDRIKEACGRFFIPAILTKEYNTAAERVYESSQKVNADFYLSINGNDPLIDPEAISAAIPAAVPQDISWANNVITNIDDPVQLMDQSNIKVVFDNDYNALYMSRFPIPFPFKELRYNYYKHIGVIGYNKKALELYSKTGPGKLEAVEGIDALRFVENGEILKLVYHRDCRSLSVDTPRDLERVREVMQLAIDRGELNVED